MPLRTVQAFISSHLDYCKAVLYSIDDGLLCHLQSVQNVAALLVTSTHQCDHTSPLLQQLSWLPACQKVKFKPFLKIVALSLAAVAPVYLADVLGCR